ncbi:MAG: hypothetical protein HY664_04860 [Chloroflexi bacterium]|nr:hypothetical protein [Chloroflexota bacterium]
MDSSLIGKIEKAKRYAQERDRISFVDFTLRFQGEHDSYILSYKDRQWQCQCNFFVHRGICSHTMALQRILAEMLPKEAFGARYGEEAGATAPRS